MILVFILLFQCSNLSKVVQSLQSISVPDMVVVLDISTGKCSYRRTWFSGRRSRSKTYRTSITRDGCRRGLALCQQYRQTTYQPSNSLRQPFIYLMNIKATGIWQFYSVCGRQIVVYWDYIISLGKKAMLDLGDERSLTTYARLLYWILSINFLSSVFFTTSVSH